MTANPSRYFAIVNPVAGGGHGAEIINLLEQTLGDSLMTVHETSPDTDFDRVVQEALADGADCLIASGGDGTVAAVAQPLQHSDIPLAIVPGGTANVIARNLGIPANYEDAIAQLTQPHDIRCLDAMQVDGKLALLAVGAGLDGAAIAGATRAEKDRLGSWAYLKQLALQLWQQKSYHLEFTIDGQHYKRHAAELIAINLPEVGLGPLSFGEDVSPDDGCINIGLVQLRGWADGLTLLWGLLRGQPEALHNITYFPMRRSLELTATPPLDVHADGEVLGQTPINIVLAPQSVCLLVPLSTEPTEQATARQAEPVLE